MMAIVSIALENVGIVDALLIEPAPAMQLDANKLEFGKVKAMRAGRVELYVEVALGRAYGPRQHQHGVRPVAVLTVPHQHAIDSYLRHFYIRKVALYL